MLRQVVVRSFSVGKSKSRLVRLASIGPLRHGGTRVTRRGPALVLRQIRVSPWCTPNNRACPAAMKAVRASNLGLYLCSMRATDGVGHPGPKSAKLAYERRHQGGQGPHGKYAAPLLREAAAAYCMESIVSRQTKSTIHLCEAR